MKEFEFNIGDLVMMKNENHSLTSPANADKHYVDWMLVEFRFFDGINNIYIVKVDDGISLAVAEELIELQERGDLQIQESPEVDPKRMDEDTYQRLRRLGLLGGDVRSHNVGASDYSQHTIQPWSIWLDYGLNPFDADIVKRVLRKKQGESRRLDYEKIIHICKERIRQIDAGME